MNPSRMDACVSQSGYPNICSLKTVQMAFMDAFIIEVLLNDYLAIWALNIVTLGQIRFFFSLERIGYWRKQGSP